MKKVLIVAIAVLFMSLGVNADAMQMKLGTTGLPTNLGGDNVTALFHQLGLYVQTTSTIAPDGSFTDVGDLNVTSLLPLTLDNEGLNSLWTLYGGWSDLAGTSFVGVNGIGNPTSYYNYTAGTLDLYASSGMPFSYGTGIGSNDDSGFTGPDADKVATLTLTNGSGELDLVELSGDVLLNWRFTYMRPGFWLYPAGTSMDVDIPLVMAYADTNTEDVEIDGPTIHSLHDGSVDIAVPEPASMVLLGSGLLGVFGAGFKKRS